MGIEPTCKTLITETLEMTKLTGKEQKEIEAELQSHFFEHEHLLQLEGYPEKERMEIMKTEFGDPQLIGKHFYVAHRRFDNIPLIGPLFYYAPVRWGVFFFLVEISKYVLASIFFSQNGEGDWIYPLLFGETGIILFSPIFVGIGIIEGVMCRKIGLSFSESIQTLAVATTPLVLLYVFSNFVNVVLPSKIVFGQIIFTNFIGWILIIFVPIIIGYFLMNHFKRLKENLNTLKKST